MIEAYPSNHLDSFRSLTNPKFIFLDEADMFRKGEQEDVRHVSERYIGKIRSLHCDGINASRSRILILQDRGRTGRHLHYTNVLNWIILMDWKASIREEEIERAKLSPGFEREYRLSVQRVHRQCIQSFTD